MSDIEKYLNKIVDYMVRHTKDGELPFDNTTMSVSDFCKNTFGLTKYEIDYVFVLIPIFCSYLVNFHTDVLYIKHYGIIFLMKEKVGELQ